MCRSTDDGRTWSPPVNVDDPGCDAAGKPYEGSLDLTEVCGAQMGDGRIMALIRPIYSPWMRETLFLWPLARDRRSLLDPIVARDCPAEFGPAPAGSIWRADHPVGLTVRLADGLWRHVLCYRVLDRDECVSDAMVTPRTGTYVEEVLSDGESVGIWQF